MPEMVSASILSRDFGTSVVATSEVVAVGAPCYSQETAGVFLFRAADGRLLRVLRSPPIRKYSVNRFGWKLALLGQDHLVVCDYAHVSPRARGGAVFIYEIDTGKLVRTIDNPQGGGSHSFGQFLATCGTAVVVCDHIGRPNGVLHVFDSETGKLVRTIGDPGMEEEPQGSHYFGQSVAAMGTTMILAGAPSHDTPVRDAGAVYLLEKDTAQVLFTFRSPEPCERQGFGHSVAAFGGNVVVGAPADNRHNPGTVYVLEGLPQSESPAARTSPRVPTRPL